MQDQPVFFDEEGLESVEARRQRRMFAIFAFMIGLTTLYYGILHYPVPDRRVFAGMMIALGISQFINWAIWRFLHRRLVPGKVALTLLSIPSILIPVTFGGIDGTAFIWLLAFTSATFLFHGLRRGMVLNFVYFGSIIVMQILQTSDLLRSFYTANQMRQTWNAIIIMTILGYAAEKGWSDARATAVRQRENMRVLLQSLPAGVWLFDAVTGAVVAANDAAGQLLGKPVPRSLTLSTVTEEFGLAKENGEPYPSSDLPASQAIATGAPAVKNDVFVKRADGSARVLRLSASPVRGAAGRVAATVTVIEDATKEHEIDKMKTEFVSLASHQLKTPLTGISWGMETLMADGENLNDTQKTVIGEVSDIVARLSHLVADLLNVSRIETGRKFTIVKKPNDIASIVGQAVKEASVIAAKRGIGIENAMPDSLVLNVDEGKFHEVVANLIGNAVKYSKDDGRVEVGITRTQKEVILYVKDDGVGIPKHQQDRIFGKFFRAENVAETVEGTGLGLYIVRVIVERHGGRIWFSSEEGKGTTFYVGFPLSYETDTSPSA